MRIIEINSVNYGSTGGIMHQTAELARKEGDIVVTICPDSHSNRSHFFSGDLLFGSIFLRNISLRMAQFTGWHHLFYLYGTWRLLSIIKKKRPDLIHLHNIHGDFLNYPLFFRFIKKNRIKVVWTFHDCWSITGHCPHFEMVRCYKWKTGCFECTRYHEYPYCRVDDSKLMYRLKKKWFTGIDFMTLVAPSKWMKELINQSYLKDYKTVQIYNGIDINVFKPLNSDFRKNHNCENKKILLGVAFEWGKRKGLDVFIELSRRLDNTFQIVLVGTDKQVDAILPKNIISINRTSSQMELVEIYTAADLFVNPTREEMFGLVNAEALACGTPVITFRSGGSPEVIDESCGIIVEKDDVDNLVQEILKICSNNPFSAEDCRKRALLFDKQNTFHQYLELYHSSYNEVTKSYN